MQILNQLGDLFLAAVPTTIIVFLFYLFLRWSFFAPIQRLLAERTARIEGARKNAEALHAQVQEKNRAYQDALRKARAEIFSEQEATRRAVLDERNAAVQQARSRANDEIHAARKRVAAEIEAARGEMESSGQELAQEIVNAILERGVAIRPAGEAR
jgi:F0F1-type ATP synthase membrane subunit b/b'